MILATPDRNDPNGMEELEYEYLRLLSIAEAYTGIEKLRQRMPFNVSERVLMLQQFIQQEQELREAHQVPHTIEEMKKRVINQVDKDDFYEDFKNRQRS